MNIGRIEGGVAPNVIPDAAGPSFRMRTAVAPDEILEHNRPGGRQIGGPRGDHEIRPPDPAYGSRV